MNNIERLIKLKAIGATFRPGSPIDDQALFAGRISQVDDAISAIFHAGRHVIVFGERGVGKTSLVNRVHQTIVEQINQPEGGPTNCDGTMTFSAMWRTAGKEVVVPGDQTLADILPEDVKPDDIRHALQDLKKTVFVFDEVDRLTDPEAMSLMAATIKTLSDHAIDTTIFIVGVADSVGALISQHGSIERNLVQIKMPRMSHDELVEIINKGLGRLQMSITSEARARIARLSQGLPYYTHLLALHAAESAVKRGSLRISIKDFRAAVKRSMEQRQATLVEAYEKAVGASSTANYSQVLLACALAKPDQAGRFSLADVMKSFRDFTGNSISPKECGRYLASLCVNERGPALQKYGEQDAARFRFSNALLQPFAIMRALSDGVIQENHLD